MKQYLLTGLFLCVVLMPGYNQKFQTMNEQFAIARTENFLQDKFGFMWLCTDDGLLKYDGYSTTRFAHDPSDPASVAGNDVACLLEDSLGNLWVGLLNDGLNYFDRNACSFKSICLTDTGDTCVIPVSVNALAYGPEGKVWIGTNRGVFILNDVRDSVALKTFTHKKEDTSSLSHEYVTCMLLDSRNRMWVGTANGVNLYGEEGGFLNHLNTQGFLQDEIVNIVEQPATHTVWVAPRYTPFPLYSWDEGRAAFLPDRSFPTLVTREYRITFDLRNRMWISARGIGAYMWNPENGEKVFFDPAKGNFHGFRIYNNLQSSRDKYGNIWIAGISVLKWPFNKKPISSLLSDNYFVYAVFADENYVWFNAGTPLRWNRHTLEIEEYWPSGYPVDLRKDLLRNAELVYQFKFAPYRKDEVLIATTRSIFIWNTRTDGFTEIPTSRGGPFRDFEFGNRNNIWICANQGSPSMIDLTDKSHTTLAMLGVEDIQRPRAVARDTNGYMWFGSRTNGLYRLDERTLEVKNFVPRPGDSLASLSSLNVGEIHAHSDGTLWIGTNLGLNQLDPETETFVTYSQDDGLRNDNIASILEDDHGNLWLGTYDGLTRFDYTTREFRHYTRADGLCNSVFSKRTAYKDLNGWMYFGGNGGVDFFHPDSMGENTIPPDVYIKSIRLHNEPLELGVAPENLDDLSFKYHENFIEIELVGLHFTSPESNRYAYRLDGGSSDQWHDLGTNRIVTLANMSPGEYALYARASNADGYWSEEKKLLDLSIAPPFWQTLWFAGILIALTGGLVYGIYRYRVRQIRREEAVKTSFNKKIAEIELKALQAQMNPHFLFNSLNSVKSLIGKKENKKAALYLTRFSQLIRQVLNNSRKKFVKLSDELEALRLYLNIESMRFHEKFAYDIHVEDDVNADFIEVPPLILQPYVENAIWHGLLPKESGERKLTIGVCRNGEFIHMIVEDNGIGRDRARKLQSNGTGKKESLGMKITGDRLKFLQEIYGKEARVEVEDLRDPRGTRIKIYLPIPE